MVSNIEYLENGDWLVLDSENKIRDYILDLPSEEEQQEYINEVFEKYDYMTEDFIGPGYNVYESTYNNMKRGINNQILDGYDDYIKQLIHFTFLDRLKYEALLSTPIEEMDYIDYSDFLTEKEELMRGIDRRADERKARASAIKKHKKQAEKAKERLKKKIEAQKKRKKNLFCINDKDYYTLEEMEDIPTAELVKLHYLNKIHCYDNMSIKQALKKSNMKHGYKGSNSVDIYRIELSFPIFITRKEAEKLLRNMKNKKDHFEIIKTDKKVKMGMNNYVNLYKLNITKPFKKPSLPKRKPRKLLKKKVVLKGGAKKRKFSNRKKLLKKKKIVKRNKRKGKK